MILAIVALSNQRGGAGRDADAGGFGAAARGDADRAAADDAAIPTLTPTPSVDAGAERRRRADGDGRPEPTPTETATAETHDTGTFPGWTGSDGDYTIIIESADSVAERREGRAEGAGRGPDRRHPQLGRLLVAQRRLPGRLHAATTRRKSDAEADLDAVRADFPDAYVQQIKT